MDVLVTYLDGMAKGATLRFTVTGQTLHALSWARLGVPALSPNSSFMAFGLL
jgi:hypothetical protein